MTKRLGLTLIVAIFGGLSLQAQTPATSSARLVARSGMVEVLRNNSWEQVAAGELINTGDRIRTATGSSAALELGAGKIITLSQATEIQVRESNGSPLVQL